MGLQPSLTALNSKTHTNGSLAMITIDELSQQTSLKTTFIRKCLKSLTEVFEPHIQRGNFNSILFSSSAVVLFDRISQLKQAGLSLPEIRKQIEETIQTAKNTDIKPAQTEEQTRLNPEGIPSHFFEQFLELQRQLIEEKEKRFREWEESNRIIKELEISKERLQAAFNLLPEGKSPEGIKQAWELEQNRKKEIARVLGELNALGPFRFRKRKKLLAHLESLEGFYQQKESAK
jgi:DNA-binding transcriptional MerR regulator